MLVIKHEGRFLGCGNVVFALRDMRAVHTVRRHLHNDDPRTFVRRHGDGYRIARPEEPRAPLNMGAVRTERYCVAFKWRLTAAGCELFVVTGLSEEPGGGGALTLCGVHAGLPGNTNKVLTVTNLASLLENDTGVFR